MKKILLPVCLALLISCNSRDQHSTADDPAPALQPLTFTAVPAPEWTALMERTSGWFGADGIFSIPLDGVEDQLNHKKPVSYTHLTLPTKRIV